MALFGRHTGEINEAAFERARAQSRAHFPTLPVGAGSNSNFAELNRHEPPHSADFLVYAANPQVHAFDDESILETPAALGQTLLSARVLAGQRPIKVSPLSFQPRFNAVATSHDGAPADIDKRAPEPLGAAWALASVAALQMAGLGALAGDSLTLGETNGPRGVLDENGLPTPMWFSLRDLAQAQSETAWAID